MAANWPKVNHQQNGMIFFMASDSSGDPGFTASYGPGSFRRFDGSMCSNEPCQFVGQRIRRQETKTSRVVSSPERATPAKKTTTSSRLVAVMWQRPPARARSQPIPIAIIRSHVATRSAIERLHVSTDAALVQRAWHGLHTLADHLQDQRIAQLNRQRGCACGASAGGWRAGTATGSHRSSGHGVRMPSPTSSD